MYIQNLHGEEFIFSLDVIYKRNKKKKLVNSSYNSVLAKTKKSGHPNNE